MDKIIINKDGFKSILNKVNKSIILRPINNKVFDESKEVVKIAENVLSDFDAAIDYNGYLNVVYFSEEKNIVLAKYSNGKITKKILYHYNDNNYFIDKFRLIFYDKILHIFYLEYNNLNSDKILLKNYYHNENWKINETAEIRNIHINPIYNVVIDKNGILHVIYITKEVNVKLYYTSFINNIWSLKSLIEESNNISYPTIYVDDNKNIHLCWVEENLIKELKYRKKIEGGWPKGSWEKVATLSFSEDISNPYITMIGSNLWFMWIKKAAFYSVITSDYGESFSKPFKLAESPLNYFYAKIIENNSEKFCYLNNANKEIPLIEEYKENPDGYGSENYFTFYIKEVQEYLNALSKKIEKLQTENIHLERNLEQKKYEITLKNRNIEDLKENLKKIYEDKSKYLLKADNLNTMFNSILSENERLKKQIKDLQNKIIILNSKINEESQLGTIDKIKLLFFKKSNERQ